MNPSYGLDIFNTGNNKTNPNQLSNAGTAQYPTFQKPIQGVNVPLGSTAGLTQPVPTSPSRNPVPAPQPQQSNNNNQGSLIDKYRASGWNDINAILADIAAGGGSKYQNSGGGGVNLDEVFNPLFKSLEGQEGIANSQYSDALNQIAQEQQLGINRLNTQKTDQETDFANDQTTFEQQKDSAMREAVRYVNALKQQGAARFGGLNSAGMAVNDITNQEFLRNQGKIQQSFSDQMLKLSDNRAKFNRYMTDAFDQFNLQVETKKKEAQAELNSRLAQIRNTKYSLESQKAQAQIGEIQKHQANIDAINNQVVAAKIQLALWSYQADQMQKQQYNQIISNYVPYQDVARADTSATLGGVPQATSYKTQKNPLLQQGEVYDEFGQLFDPYQTGA